MEPSPSKIAVLLILLIGSLTLCGRKAAEQDLFNEAQKYFNEGDKQKAAEIYEKIIEEFPGSENRSKAIFYLGYLYANEFRDYAKAEKYYRKLLDEYPDDELVESTRFELDNLGKDPSEIDSLLEKRIQEQQAAGEQPVK